MGTPTQGYEGDGLLWAVESTQTRTNARTFSTERCAIMFGFVGINASVRRRRVSVCVFCCVCHGVLLLLLTAAMCY